MYTESFDNFSSAELMHYTSTPENTSNADCINNFVDFNIYSQTPSTLTTDFNENELYNPLHQIGQQAVQLVNQQQEETTTPFEQINVNHYNFSNLNPPLNNHIDPSPVEEKFHYTTSNQSDLVPTSPHGYSENNNNGPYSVHSTPILTSEPLFQDNSNNNLSDHLLYSPIVQDYRNLSITTSPATFGGDIQLFDDVSTPTIAEFGTPYTVPSCTPLITPLNTPYINAINTPYVTNSSPFSATSTINTPFFPHTPLNIDTPLVEPIDENGKNWFSLFAAAPSANVFPTEPSKPVGNYNDSNNNNNNFKGSPSVYEDNIYENHIGPYFEGCNQIVTMASISLNTIPSETGEKKEPEIAPDSPKSHQSETSASADKIVSTVVETLTTSPPKSTTEPHEYLKVEQNLEAIKTEPTMNVMSTNTPDSAPTTPVDAPNKLVSIRPRPHDEDDGENESTRRSKRQRTMSVSEENDDEENEEVEKKYNCPECGRGFNRKFNMQTHRATHDPNRVKPFACEHPNCGSRFTRKHDLKRHINGIHKGEKVHECTVCRKPFSRKDAWKRHIATCGKM